MQATQARPADGHYASVGAILRREPSDTDLDMVAGLIRQRDAARFYGVMYAYRMVDGEPRLSTETVHWTATSRQMARLHPSWVEPRYEVWRAAEREHALADRWYRMVRESPLGSGAAKDGARKWDLAGGLRTVHRWNSNLRASSLIALDTVTNEPASLWREVGALDTTGGRRPARTPARWRTVPSRRVSIAPPAWAPITPASPSTAARRAPINRAAHVETASHPAMPHTCAACDGTRRAALRARDRVETIAAFMRRGACMDDAIKWTAGHR